MDDNLTRREFVKTAGVVTGALALSCPVLGGEAATVPPLETPTATAVPIQLTINGQLHGVSLDPRVTLLDLLREQLSLTGTKKGCDHGQCGACTVLANGRRINSCLSLAVTHDGDEITTVEGLANGSELHPVQSAFIEYDGFQCGYCTPGQICSAVGLFNELKNRHDRPAELAADYVREQLSGNICRCGAYPGIVEAVQTAYRGFAQRNQNAGFMPALGHSSESGGQP